MHKPIDKDPGTPAVSGDECNCSCPCAAATTDGETPGPDNLQAASQIANSLDVYMDIHGKLAP